MMAIPTSYRNTYFEVPSRDFITSLFMNQKFGKGVMPRAWNHERVGKHHRAATATKKARKAQRKARRNNR